MSLLDRFRKVDEPKNLDVQFFAHFVSAVGYLYKVLGTATIENGLPDMVQQVEPGKQVIFVKRKWLITGIEVEDVAPIVMDGPVYLDCEIGHEADYSMIVCYGWTHEDDGPVIMTWWQSDKLAKFEPPLEYYQTRGGPAKSAENGTYPYLN